MDETNDRERYVVLVIEDHQEVRLSLVRELARAGCFVRGVERLAGATQEALAGVDVILLDLDLPDSTKYQTVERIQTLREYGAVVILSGWVDRDVARDAPPAGAFAVLSKTASIESIIGTVRSAGARQRERRDDLDLLREVRSRFAKATGRHDTLSEWLRSKLDE